MQLIQARLCLFTSCIEYGFYQKSTVVTSDPLDTIELLCNIILLQVLCNYLHIAGVLLGLQASLRNFLSTKLTYMLSQ